MQTKLRDGSVMVAGTCGRDAEFKTVGEKNIRKCTVGLAVGKKPDPDGGEKPTTAWCNVVAWHDLASLLAVAQKGDKVFVIGALKSREYNGKVYTDLEAEYLSVASVHAAAATAPTAETFGGFSEYQDDGELPY